MKKSFKLFFPLIIICIFLSLGVYYFLSSTSIETKEKAISIAKTYIQKKYDYSSEIRGYLFYDPQVELKSWRNQYLETVPIHSISNRKIWCVNYSPEIEHYIDEKGTVHNKVYFDCSLSVIIDQRTGKVVSCQKGTTTLNQYFIFPSFGLLLIIAIIFTLIISLFYWMKFSKRKKLHK